MLALSPAIFRLYLVTDQSMLLGRSLADVVAAAVQGGVTCVQLREKSLGDHDMLAQALLLKELLAPYAVPLVINDRIDIALACGADGLHLGQSDLSVNEARRRLPSHVFIGLSVETMNDVLQSATQAVDYLGASPVFATPTKLDTKTPWGLAGLAAVRLMTHLPLVAIGGIHAGTAREVIRAGADGLAVVSALCAADDPKAAAAHLRQLCDDELALRKKNND